jgi:hypothetical protein
VSGIEHLFIVGAGFSYNAGLPLTTNFTRELLNVRHFLPEGPSVRLVQLLRKFVLESFKAADEDGKFWPELEDIFTCVDLSANTGHHLGLNYSPSELRTVRRAIIVRTIRMLQQTSKAGAKASSKNWTRLRRFFSLIDAPKCAFLSLNWDTIIEEGMANAQNIQNVDYLCQARAARFKGEKIIERNFRKERPIISVLKPHGSANWLYCDCCRQLFWFPHDQTSRIATQLFKPSDWQVANKILATGSKKRDLKQFECPECEANALGTRFATFSYRKALDFPMHARSWLSAEHLLREAHSWIFIGYSLPAADYEFKHLLKRVEASRRVPPKMLLVTGGDDAQRTADNYRKFFGTAFKRSRGDIWLDGFSDGTIERLAEIGALSSKP